MRHEPVTVRIPHDLFVFVQYLAWELRRPLRSPALTDALLTLLASGASQHPYFAEGRFTGPKYRCPKCRAESGAPHCYDCRKEINDGKDERDQG